MNSYELSRGWFDFSFENPELIKPVHSAIYFFAVEHCNRLGWKEKFGFPSQMTMDAIGVKNYQTYGKALKDLVSWGFIIMIEQSKNQYSANIISICATTKNRTAHSKALDKALLKHGSKQTRSTASSIVSIDKQLNHKTIKPLNQEEEGVYKKISTLSDEYKSNDRILEAVLKNGQQLAFSKEDLINKLDDFILHLETTGETTKTKKDFNTHFLNWLRKRKEKSSDKKEKPTPAEKVFGDFYEEANTIAKQLNNLTLLKNEENKRIAG